MRFEDPKKWNFRNLKCIYFNLGNITFNIDDENGLINDIKQLILAKNTQNLALWQQFCC